MLASLLNSLELDVSIVCVFVCEYYLIVNIKMKASLNAKFLGLAVIVLVLCPSQALLQDFFPGITSGIQQGLSTVQNGFTRLMSPLSNMGSSISSPFSGGGLFGGSGNNRRSLVDSFPVVGSCDRIAYQGVANCMTNFRPSTIGTKGQCW